MNAEGDEIGNPQVFHGSPSLSDWRAGTDLPELNADEIRVWLVDLDAGLSPDEVETAEPGPELGVLDDTEKARSARFIRAHDRRRFARCRSALRQILGALLTEPPGSLLFRAVAQGKPELDFATMGVGEHDARALIRFNLSHSSDLALIGVCLGREIGVDLERIKPISEAERIVASFFSPLEQTEFATFSDHAKALAFFRGWTRKEAVLKGLGIGLAGLSARYETGFGTGELEPRFLPATPAPRVKEWRLWEAAPRAGFVATVAVQVPAGADPAAPDRTGPGNVVASPGDNAVH
jgi:4'-phosphopantetheinyl transferase